MHNHYLIVKRLRSLSIIVLLFKLHRENVQCVYILLSNLSTGPMFVCKVHNLHNPLTNLFITSL